VKAKGYLRDPLLIIAVGSNLRAIRMKKKITQEELAHMAGIAVSQVGRIERGELNISISTLSVLARALDVSPKDMFDTLVGKDGKPPRKKKK
jgi:transcriptional regulator with XRE-family HTH domain